MLYQQIGSLGMSANSISSNRPASRASLFPMGQGSDQDIINSMKRGSGRPMRRSSATIQSLILPPAPAYAATA